MSDTKHTPTPWRILYNENNETMSIVYKYGRTIVRPSIDFEHDTGCVRLKLSSCAFDSIDFEAQHGIDMAFLIRAVNHHDELVAACEALLGLVDLVDGSGGNARRVGEGQRVEKAAIRILAKIKDA